MRRLRQTPDGEQGAILVHMALAMLALLSFLTIVVDYGVFWTSRGQSQNSADAGALAGALALAYDQSSTTIARESAVAAATSNMVFGAAPSVIPGTDVTFPTLPGRYRRLCACRCLSNRRSRQSAPGICPHAGWCRQPDAARVGYCPGARRVGQ